ncbi:DNA recombination protein RmuC [Gorillibacterium massiliense]|uniref:DNA recombination protein RmuC n=1 Tax=Gorillibacterium massiliense TaxID=1280390 RepID=UPI0004B29A0D|nr:DNA recombination protein RmuC [Gorillibacterium massiliense]
MVEYVLLGLSLLLNAVVLILLVSQKGKGDTSALKDKLTFVERQQERLERSLLEQFSLNRSELQQSERRNREETGGKLEAFNRSLLSFLEQLSSIQKNQLGTTEDKLDKLRDTVDQRLKELQEDNGKKLEQMRATVDEKLHATLEQRLGESFKLVSERLEQVHKGLGEMQTLASGVGDLKRVLTNVKTRGTWGEVQLGNLLEQLLTLDQYERNVATRKGSAERVEFAIKLPAKDGAGGVVWLPIDSKFPTEDYQRLLDAQDAGDPDGVAQYMKQLENRLKAEGKDIRNKYIEPPHTTDFGILFLPTEGLYAEALRMPGLSEWLQRECRVVLTGPTTLSAFLNSLQMGFRTLAIEKRSSEVWSLLGAVKTEFGNFGDLLDKTHKKLQEASNTIENAARKSRNIERKLNKVQELPVPEAAELLQLETAER